jgi:hypothetical protein
MLAAKSHFRKGGEVLPDLAANRQVRPTFSEMTLAITLASELPTGI